MKDEVVMINFQTRRGGQNKISMTRGFIDVIINRNHKFHIRQGRLQTATAWGG